MPHKKSKTPTEKTSQDELKNEIMSLQEELGMVKGNLARRIRFIEQLLATLPNLAYIYDIVEKRIVFANQVSIPFLGYSTDAILSLDSTTFKEIIHPEDIDHVRAHYAAYSQSSDEGIYEYEFRVKHNFGDWHWVSIRETPYEHDTDGSIVRVLGTAEDATERRQAQEKLWYTSTHDNLTGLYNRSYYEEEIARLERGRRFPVTIMIGDVDGMKEVNEKLGFPAGDLLICGAAEIIKECFRGEDVVARIGGDEFGVLLPEFGSSSIDGIRAKMDEKIEVYNKAHPKNPVNISMGFATADNKEALREAVREADNNMAEYKQKGQDKNRKPKSKKLKNQRNSTI